MSQNRLLKYLRLLVASTYSYDIRFSVATKLANRVVVLSKSRVSIRHMCTAQGQKMTLISAFVVGYGSTLLFIFASGLRCCMIAGIFCLRGGEPPNILADRHSKNAASAEEAWSGGVC